MLGEVGTWDAVALRLQVEDQAYSADLLRRGAVLAAVTSEPVAVQGCAAERLGAMRYVPAAAPDFAARWRRGRGVDWARMPVVVFNEKDDLQDQVLRDRGVTERRRSCTGCRPRRTSTKPYVAGSAGRSSRSPSSCRTSRDGRLAVLGPRLHVDVDLWWHRWRLDSPLLTRLTEAVRTAARAGLRR